MELQTEIYIRLKAEEEMLNVEESGKKSLVQILDMPEVPTSKLRPNVIINMIIAFVFSLILFIIIVYAKEFYKFTGKGRINISNSKFK